MCMCARTRVCMVHGDEFGLPEETEGSFVGRVGAGGEGRDFFLTCPGKGWGKAKYYETD